MSRLMPDELEMHILLMQESIWNNGDKLSRILEILYEQTQPPFFNDRFNRGADSKNDFITNQEDDTFLEASTLERSAHRDLQVSRQS